MDVESAKKLLSSKREDKRSSCCREIPLKIGHNFDLDIIIPCYNVEPYIRECIDSVINQKTSFSFRVIAINDGSSDNTLGVLKEYEKIDNYILLDQTNHGVSYARNRAITLLDSEYVMFIDSDDMLFPDAIENMLTLAKKEDADYVQGKIIQIMPDGTERGQFGVCHDGKITTRREIAGIPGGKLFRSALFESLIFPEYTFEDSIFKEIVFDLAKNKYSFTGPVYKYRVNNTGISTTARKRPQSIDGLWINLMLGEERQSKFGLEPTDDYYEYKISTFELMHRRLRSIGLKYDRAGFIIYSDYIKRTFKDMTLKDKKFRWIEKSLKNGKYLMFLLGLVKRKLIGNRA
jgi:glycosyltransferase involved in cell wall biosynthesis